MQRAALEDRSPETLAEKYAIDMLEEIARVMDDRKMSDDDRYNTIMKILCFVNVPPHI